MKIIQLTFALLLAAIALPQPARAADTVAVRAILITATNQKRAADPKLAPYEAELQRNRMLVLREANEMLPIAKNDGIRRNHLGIKQGAFRQLTVERPAMPIRPIHHWGDTETMT